jgi:cytoskeleton protein RodZ
MTDPGAATGPRLKAERERRGLSSQKAADELHLDGWIIDALEAEDYLRIGPSVYAKGHLKRYAAFLGLPAAEIMAGYESRAQTPPPPAAQSSTVRLHTGAQAAANARWPLIATAAVLVSLVLGLFWWKPWHQRESGPPAAEISTTNPGATMAGGAAPPAEAAVSGTEPASSGTQPAMALAGAPAEAPSSRAPTALSAPPSGVSPTLFTSAAAAAPEQSDTTAGAGRARLRLSFSADSWVDVHDAEGRRAFSGQGRANSVKTIAGVAPMRVYLGFASGVQLEINNRAVAIGPQFLAGDVARFEAGADGILRRDSHSVPAPGAATPAQTRNARPTS